jgi:hypothetical protein
MPRFALPVLALTFLIGVTEAQSAVVYTVNLSGANENPGNPSTASGNALLTLDGDSLTVDLSFAGLTGGPAAAAHIHCCVPRPGNVAVAVGFPGFPNTTSDTYTHTFDLTDSTIYTASFLGSGTAADAEAALIAGLASGTAYVNIHNTGFGDGEIRGFPVLVPEPANVLLLATGLLAVALRVGAARRKRN